MQICGPIVNCTYNAYDGQQGECRIANEVPIDYIHFNDPRCPRYSFNYQEELKITIIPNITENYLDVTESFLDGLEIDEYYPSDRILYKKSVSLHLMSEQTNIIYWSPTIVKRIFSKYAYGLAGGKSIEYASFNAHTSITTLNTPNITTLVLRSTSMDIHHQEETFYDLGTIISSIGGFFSSLSGIFVFLFGASKLAPWGFLQIHVFNCLCTKYQRKFVRKLKNNYEPIPFVSGRTKNFTLEERVQSIENMLQEYYLDTDFLNILLENNGKVDKIKN
ncbi:hypothetical protein RhiirA5_423563 [Rhizophagus irregularis]|uniref:Uncharacterized protein n=1 Tax=Rhizophagus irregularis TaxID=588596 RepID=A0A2N0RA57_9GLOM|nr:hypothetical protein RhiirA5_423563 [Rhizophagus irregularis]PKC60169.1 hypothetical protein RhiirA1_468419 [Rhizophagus irregularis]CAB4479280.1 unnamed protein product [Rhizophagus irregularis]CAB5098399.1 unnamed protein product [Rhizophagus irregularis]